MKRFPIGVDDYKKLREGNYLSVDKTLLIQEWWQEGAEVTILTRPRRFGKTINLSMLRYFFEKTPLSERALFEHTSIWQYQEFRELQGSYPVIFLSFKDIKRRNWEEAYQEFSHVIAEEIKRVLSSLILELDLYDRRLYDRIQSLQASYTELTNSLKWATKILKDHDQKNVIVLIDEYDAPITHAYLYGYYEVAVDFVRDLFSKGLKGNPHLCKGFLTGVVRTAKDGILSGLNSPLICTMLDKGFSDKFGFTEEEVECLLALAGYKEKKEEAKRWYNGYTLGIKYTSNPQTMHLCKKVYNPWSILQYLHSGCVADIYWTRTGSTELLERLIAGADGSIQQELISLLEGNSLALKKINQDVILLDLNRKKQEPWSFLFFAGYLTTTKHTFDANEHQYTLDIPNLEIALLYKTLVTNALSKGLSLHQLTELLKALMEGNLSVFSSLLTQLVVSLCSYHDLPSTTVETSLHLFVLGLLASLADRYLIKSNLESGDGRYDILMVPKNEGDFAILLEFKQGKERQLEKLAQEALLQMKTHRYEQQVRDLGYRGKILYYGIAVHRKQLVVKSYIDVLKDL